MSEGTATVKRKRGRPAKYATQEERVAARRARHRGYYKKRQAAQRADTPQPYQPEYPHPPVGQ